MATTRMKAVVCGTVSGLDEMARAMGSASGTTMAAKTAPRASASRIDVVNAALASSRSRLPMAIEARVEPPTPTSVASTLRRFTMGDATRTPDMATGPTSCPTKMVSMMIVTCSIMAAAMDAPKNRRYCPPSTAALRP